MDQTETTSKDSRSEKKRAVDGGSKENDSKKQKTDNDQVQLLALQLKVKEMEDKLAAANNELEEMREKNDELSNANATHTLQNVQKKRYSENRQLLLALMKELPLPKPKSFYDKKRCMDLNHGEGNWWSPAIRELFDTIYQYDAFKNKENGYGKDIGTYMELEQQLRNMSTNNKKIDVMFSDNPYIERSGGHNGFNSSQSSHSIVEMDHNYGLIGFKMPRCFLIHMMLKHLKYALQGLKEGGYLLMKTMRHQFGLNEYILDASFGTPLTFVGEIAFPSSRAPSTANMSLVNVTHPNDVSQLMVFRLDSKERISIYEMYSIPSNKRTSLDNKLSVIGQQVRKELYKIGKKKNTKCRLHQLCVSYVLDHLKPNKKKQRRKMLRGLLGKLGNKQFDYTSFIESGSTDNWKRFVDWKTNHTEWTLLELQGQVMKESSRLLEVEDMMCILFAYLLEKKGVDKSLDDKTQSDEIRREWLAKCDIKGKVQNRFMNGTVKRLFENAQNLRKREQEKMIIK